MKTLLFAAFCDKQIKTEWFLRSVLIIFNKPQSGEQERLVFV